MLTKFKAQSCKINLNNFLTSIEGHRGADVAKIYKKDRFFLKSIIVGLFLSQTREMWAREKVFRSGLNYYYGRGYLDNFDEPAISN